MALFVSMCFMLTHSEKKDLVLSDELTLKLKNNSVAVKYHNGCVYKSEVVLIGMANTSSGGGNCCSFISLFISFVFVCISLTHSDNSMVYDACGHTLRDVMMADLLVPVCCSILSCIVVEVLNCCACVIIPIASILFLVCGVVCLLCLGAVTVDESIKALSIPDCVLAMSSTEGGINSPSANTGSPLLALMGFFVGVPYLIMSIAVIAILIVLLVVWACSPQKSIDKKILLSVIEKITSFQLPSAPVIVSYLFLFIALSHSNSEIVSAACGVTLRNVLIAVLLIPVIFLICYFIGLGIFDYFYENNDDDNAKYRIWGIATAVTAVFWVLIMLCLSALTVSESINALNNPNCVSAMSSKEGGINSPSANLGSPLLAIMGLAIGIPYLITFVIFTVVILILSCVFAFYGRDECLKTAKSFTWQQDL